MAQSPYEQWIPAMLAIAHFYRLDASEENVRVLSSWEKRNPTDDVLRRMARHMGLDLRFTFFSMKHLDPWRLPLVAEFKNGQVGVLQQMDKKGTVSVIFSGDEGLALDLPLSHIKRYVKRFLILRPISSVQDARVDDYIKPHQKNWFRSIVFKDWPRYLDITLASLITNVLALSGILFSIQTYDRVVPSQSLSTLGVLFGGVMIAIFFEFIMRIVRARLTDIVGKRADLRISDLVYGHALRIRNDARPKSTGTFIAQIRELESIRETITSTTMGALVDLPFVILFFFILWLIGGPLVLVPLCALPLLIIPGLLAQKPLSALAQEGMRESALRNAMLVEAVQSIEDIKLLRAETRFQNQWNQVNAISADVGIRQRTLISWLTTLSQETQSIIFALTLFVGAIMVIKGEITTGVLVGSSILGSRTIVPLAQWAGVFSRLQQAKISYQALDELMKKPVDQADHDKFLHRPLLLGKYQIEGADVFHNEEDKRPALSINQLSIRAGDRIAILGRMGAGKSTLLQLLSGMIRASKGKVLLDDTKMEQIDPADLRRDIGYLSQNARLFFGTVRDNLTMGRPFASDEEILRALTLAGALPLIQAQGHGLDYIIQEGGYGLSGGQRQALLLARTLLLDPHILLLDEPTAVMDDVTERMVVDQVKPWLESRTLIVATHRPAILEWAQQIMVINQGQIVLYGPKEAVLEKLKSGL
ncbi:type I secretion system permease/ATPase [Desulfococcaceae bacterium OttesenSCG-928-F15]|nr:type I secretion system permease/ATPase [Desulfococcaceae bacterium OttesenSCG-928-F15]